ncbi:hypothetical protein [Mesorhizobium dulcispinae]|uniref:hypothetical protein n=1 Tax=Mesorhizobium dulcispinae TaxID=3072316 RepID=UPI002A239DEF|nr:hypothetical protein [Mesorhizobium sp. VK23D]MDX8522071.1 hypothetical protein [Mesorhizobium sp. VK23D]
MDTAPGRPNSNLSDFFGRHLLAICVTYRLRNSSEDQSPLFAAYNGTLIEISGATCFLTAGHVLADLQEKLEDDRIEIIDVVLADTFSQDQVSDKPVPFDVRNERFYIVDDKQQGLDFGAIPLRPYYTNLLALNGTIALDEKQWIHQHEVLFDGYAMLGLPQQLTSPAVDSSGTASVSPSLFWVMRHENPPEGTPQTTYPRFVAQLGNDLPVTDIKGMSGGPIFGFRIEGENAVRYWVVALQSSWLPTSRIIFGCPLPTMAPLLKDLMTNGEPSAAVR